MANVNSEKNNPMLAIDLGTTTIAMALIFGDKINILPVTENPGRLYGSDVISRMNNTATRALGENIKDMMWDTILTSLSDAGYTTGDLSWIVLSGNTPMMHMIFGYDVSGMLSSPFTPHTLSMQNKKLGEVIASDASADLISMPCISPFVGGDIVSGIYACELDKAKEPSMLIDLGTNGEIVLSYQGRLFCTSVACGPALEGGNISIGMTATAGAIKSVNIRRGFCQLAVIDDSPQIKGICGSGIIDVLYELYADGLIDKHGTFKNTAMRASGFCLHRGPVTKPLILTQEDIRNIQVAKGAIRAGVEALLAHCGVDADDIKTCYVAGSFGKHLDMKKALGINLFPKAFYDRIISAGNTSLAGAVGFLKNPFDMGRLNKISETTESISLADDELFKDAYIRFMELG